MGKAYRLEKAYYLGSSPSPVPLPHQVAGLAQGHSDGQKGSGFPWNALFLYQNEESHACQSAASLDGHPLRNPGESSTLFGLVVMVSLPIIFDSGQCERNNTSCQSLTVMIGFHLL
jgi:hypothetical protein